MLPDSRLLNDPTYLQVSASATGVSPKGFLLFQALVSVLSLQEQLGHVSRACISLQSILCEDTMS